MTRACPVCGEVFELTRKHPDKRFCSRECSLAAQREQRAAQRAERKCLWCGRRFETPHTVQIYCCEDCRWAATHHRRKLARLAVMPGEEDMLEKVRDYLSLPTAERYARRGELTAAERKLAEKVWNAEHADRVTAVN